MFYTTLRAALTCQLGLHVSSDFRRLFGNDKNRPTWSCHKCTLYCCTLFIQSYNDSIRHDKKLLLSLQLATNLLFLDVFYFVMQRGLPSSGSCQASLSSSHLNTWNSCAGRRDGRRGPIFTDGTSSSGSSSSRKPEAARCSPDCSSGRVGPVPVLLQVLRRNMDNSSEVREEERHVECWGGVAVSDKSGVKRRFFFSQTFFLGCVKPSKATLTWFKAQRLQKAAGLRK